MGKKGNRFKYFLVGVGIAFIMSMIFASGIKTELEKYGIEGYYTTVEEFLPFALTPSEKLNCTISQLIYNIDDLGARRLQSGGGIEENVVPKTQLALVTTSTGNTVKTVEGELRLKCASSSTADPYLSKGTVAFQIFATNQKGETVKIKDSSFITLKSANVDGVTVKIATWSLSASEIESKIGGASASYITTVTANAVGTLYFKEKPSESREFYYMIRGDSIAAFRYKVVSNANLTPIIDDLSGLKQRKVELKLLNSDDAIVDLRKANRVSVVGSLYDWEQSKEGYPVLKLYYTDANALPSEKVTPLQQKTLTSYKGSIGIGSVADFTYSLYLGSNPKLGEYKVTFSSGLKDGKPIRDTVASITFEVIKSVPTCEETNSCPPPPPPPPSCEEDGTCPQSPVNEIQECLRTGNIMCIANTLGISIQIIAGIIIFLTLVIIIAIGVAIARKPKMPPRY